MPKPVEKCCGTCWWACDWYPTKHNPPRINKNLAARCSFPKKRVLNNLPESYKAFSFSWEDPKPSSIHFYQGSKCTCWRPVKELKFKEVNPDA